MAGTYEDWSKEVVHLPEQEIRCPLCQTLMEYRRTHGHEFWECPACDAELWPYDERVEKEIRKTMYVTMPKKKSRGSRRRRFRTRKPGEKVIPWYRREL